MNLPDPATSKAALLLGGALALGYVIRQGLDHASDMEFDEKARLGKALLLVAGSSLAYYAVSENTKWKLPQF